MTQRELDARVASIQYTETADLNLPAIEVAGDAFEAGVEWADGHPRWISVEDELPEKGEVVFITDGELTDTGFYDYDDAWQPYMQWLGDITHWMPLPQPPKEGGEQ